MDGCILLVLFDLVDHVHGLEDNCEIGLVVGVNEEVNHLPLDDVEVVDLEDARRLKDEHLNQLAQRLRNRVVLVVGDQLQEDFGKDVAVFVRLDLADEVLLVAKRPFRAHLYQELNDRSESSVSVGLVVELLEETDHDLVSAEVQELLLALALFFYLL